MDYIRGFLDSLSLEDDKQTYSKCNVGNKIKEDAPYTNNDLPTTQLHESVDSAFGSGIDDNDEPTVHQLHRVKSRERLVGNENYIVVDFVNDQASSKPKYRASGGGLKKENQENEFSERYNSLDFNINSSSPFAKSTNSTVDETNVQSTVMQNKLLFDKLIADQNKCKYANVVTRPKKLSLVDTSMFEERINEFNGNRQRSTTCKPVSGAEELFERKQRSASVMELTDRQKNNIIITIGDINDDIIDSTNGNNTTDSNITAFNKLTNQGNKPVKKRKKSVFRKKNKNSVSEEPEMNKEKTINHEDMENNKYSAEISNLDDCVIELTNANNNGSINAGDNNIEVTKCKSREFIKAGIVEPKHLANVGDLKETNNQNTTEVRDRYSSLDSNDISSSPFTNSNNSTVDETNVQSIVMQNKLLFDKLIADQNKCKYANLTRPKKLSLADTSMFEENRKFNDNRQRSFTYKAVSGTEELFERKQRSVSVMELSNQQKKNIVILSDKKDDSIDSTTGNDILDITNFNNVIEQENKPVRKRKKSVFRKKKKNSVVEKPQINKEKMINHEDMEKNKYSAEILKLDDCVIELVSFSIAESVFIDDSIESESTVAIAEPYVVIDDPVEREDTVAMTESSAAIDSPIEIENTIAMTETSVVIYDPVEREDTFAIAEISVAIDDSIESDNTAAMTEIYVVNDDPIESQNTVAMTESSVVMHDPIESENTVALTESSVAINDPIEREDTVAIADISVAIDDSIESDNTAAMTEIYVVNENPIESENTVAMTESSVVMDDPIESENTVTMTEPSVAIDSPMEIENNVDMTETYVVIDDPIESKNTVAMTEPSVAIDSPIKIEYTVAMTETSVVIDDAIERDDTVAIAEISVAIDSPIESENTVAKTETSVVIEGSIGRKSTVSMTNTSVAIDDPFKSKNTVVTAETSVAIDDIIKSENTVAMTETSVANDNLIESENTIVIAKMPVFIDNSIEIENTVAIPDMPVSIDDSIESESTVVIPELPVSIDDPIEIENTVAIPAISELPVDFDNSIESESTVAIPEMSVAIYNEETNRLDANSDILKQNVVNKSEVINKEGNHLIEVDIINTASLNKQDNMALPKIPVIESKDGFIIPVASAALEKTNPCTNEDEISQIDAGINTPTSKSKNKFRSFSFKSFSFKTVKKAKQDKEKKSRRHSSSMLLQSNENQSADKDSKNNKVYKSLEDLSKTKKEKTKKNIIVNLFRSKKKKSEKYEVFVSSDKFRTLEIPITSGPENILSENNNKLRFSDDISSIDRKRNSTREYSKKKRTNTN